MINYAEKHHLNETDDISIWEYQRMLSAEMFKQVAERARIYQQEVDFMNKHIIGLLGERNAKNK